MCDALLLQNFFMTKQECRNVVANLHKMAELLLGFEAKVEVDVFGTLDTLLYVNSAVDILLIYRHVISTRTFLSEHNILTGLHFPVHS